MGRSRRKVQTHSEEKETVRKPQQGIGVRCPVCGGKTHVSNSIARPEQSIQGRYRQCDDELCKHTVYTEETIKRDVIPRA